VVWTRVARRGNPNVMRNSDDGGGSWSRRLRISPRQDPLLFDFGAIPLVQRSGDVTIAYISFDLNASLEVVRARTLTATGMLRPTVRVRRFLGFEPPDLRTGANVTAAADPEAGVLYIAWQDSRFRPGMLNDIVISASRDGGRTWSQVRRVNGDPLRDGVDHFTPSLAVAGGRLSATYQTRGESGRSEFVDNRYVVSADGGRNWTPELVVGPPANLQYAAKVGPDFRFLGDYAGLAAAKHRAFVVWCRSSSPDDGQAPHQTTWAATIR
jgi:hypothetical protein